VLREMDVASCCTVTSRTGVSLLVDNRGFNEFYENTFKV
jgi:hypothetical protein